jgi:3-oxoacyl-[acyl-carrier protein] reductase
MADLTGRIALVTGGSRGIGREIAKALAQAGADVAINYRERAADAEAAADEIRRLGRRAVAVRADVSLAAEVGRLIGAVNEQLGAIDILVNNAGISRPQPLDQIRESDWDELIAVNLKSCFLLSQAVLPSMRARRWGRIINISSVAAQNGGVVGPHYAASKAGMIGMMHHYAVRLAKEGITANVISPALIETEMVRANPNARADIIPIGRFGAVSEVSDVAVMLAGNGYITGQTINVNGGWYMS